MNIERLYSFGKLMLNFTHQMKVVSRLFINWDRLLLTSAQEPMKRRHEVDEGNVSTNLRAQVFGNFLLLHVWNNEQLTSFPFSATGETLFLILHDKHAGDLKSVPALLLLVPMSSPVSDHERHNVLLGPVKPVHSWFLDPSLSHSQSSFSPITEITFFCLFILKNVK